MRVKTAYGRQCEDIRHSRRETMREMGSKVGVSASALSAAECGKSKPSARVVEKIIEVYGLPQKEAETLRDNAVSSYNQVRIDVRGLTEHQAKLAYAMSKYICRLPAGVCERIISIIKKGDQK